MKAITLMQLGAQYLMYTKQCNIDKKDLIESKHLELSHHIAQLKSLDARQKSQIKDVKKRIHDIEVA